VSVEAIRFALTSNFRERERDLATERSDHIKVTLLHVFFFSCLFLSRGQLQAPNNRRLQQKEEEERKKERKSQTTNNSNTATTTHKSKRRRRKREDTKRKESIF